MHIAEVVTIAKSLPLLRLNTYKSLILSYSADYRRIFGKNTTHRAGDFFRKQEAWPCIPVQSRNYLCAQNGNDNLMRSLKDAKMEVNGSGGRLDRKTSKEKSVKKGKRQKEKGHCRRRETGQTTGKEVWFYMFGRACPVWRIKSFFPVCLPCVTACSIHGSGGQTRLSAYGSKEQQKRKIVRNP